MAEYYFVGTMLPPLSFNAFPEINFDQLDLLYRDNLSKSDYEKTLVIRRFFDILNLRSLWLGEDFDSRGILSPLDIGEAFASRTGLPDYVFEFIERYTKDEERIRYFPFLLAKFFQSANALSDHFLKKYLNFEREMRLVMTAFRAKKLKRDLSVEFQYEDPEEELIAQLLAMQDSDTYEPPEKYRELKILFDKYGNDPMALQKALDEYRFEIIDSFVDMADPFSIDRLLAYLIQFLIVEKWFELDKEKGGQIVNDIVKL